MKSKLPKRIEDKLEKIFLMIHEMVKESFEFEENKELKKVNEDECKK